MSARNVEKLDRYLLSGEQIVVAVHRHWITVVEPILTAVAGFVVAVWVAGSSDSLGQARLADLLWWLWFALLGRALFYVYEWRQEWFVATDRRLLLVYGFIVRKVDMMPLGKVTDMTFHRTVPGRLLGYGTFVLESAGQDQALSKVDFLPHPDDTYRAIIAQIFHREGDPLVESEDDAYEEEALQEPDPALRRTFLGHLTRFVPGRRGRPPGEDEFDDDDEFDDPPVRGGRRREEVPARAAARRAGWSRQSEEPMPSRQRTQPGRAPHERPLAKRDLSRRQRRAEPPPEDPDTESLDLGDLAGRRDHAPGRTIYRSATDDAPPDDFRDDAAGWWPDR